MYIENKVVTHKELKQKIASLVGKNPELKVVVAADQSCRFREVVRIIDTLKALQVKSLNIATRTEQIISK